MSKKDMISDCLKILGSGMMTNPPDMKVATLSGIIAGMDVILTYLGHDEDNRKLIIYNSLENQGEPGHWGNNEALITLLSTMYAEETEGE